jgi:hypothetical protein
MAQNLPFVKRTNTPRFGLLSCYPIGSLFMTHQPAYGYSELKDAITASVRYTLRNAYLFGFLYFSLRTALIVLATCASAKGIAFLRTDGPPEYSPHCS